MSTKKFMRILVALAPAMIFFGCGSGGSDTSTLNAGATGTATLSWHAVTSYNDGSPLTTAGYYVYYGMSPSQHTFVDNVTNLSNPNSPTYVVRNLPSGTYYFAVSAYDAFNVESQKSIEVSKTIP
jgi:hypothetical protein